MNFSHYLNNTVWCKVAPSVIHGIGVVAIRKIPKGTRISDYTYSEVTQSLPMLTMTPKEFEDVRDEIKSIILDRVMFEEGMPLRFISPNHDQVLQSFMNHSDTPNTNGQFALQDIEEGEELTEDYSDLFGKPHALTKKHHPYI